MINDSQILVALVLALASGALALLLGLDLYR